MEDVYKKVMDRALVEEFINRLENMEDDVYRLQRRGRDALGGD